MNVKAPVTGLDWEQSLAKAAKIILEKNRFLFGASLDPDSVGSMLSLALYLRLIGKKKVYLVMKEPLGPNFDYLQKIIIHNKIDVITDASKLKEIKDDVDIVMFFDTPNPKLLPFFNNIKEDFLSRQIPVIESDHHFGGDSEELSQDSVKLYRKANANAEIIAELLQLLHKSEPNSPDPFKRRNILLPLITGMLGDTVGGKVVNFKQDYEYWMGIFGKSLKQETYQKGAFNDQHDINKHMHALAEDQKLCLDLLVERITMGQGVAVLNILDSVYPEIKYFCKPFDSAWFSDVRDYLLNIVPERSGKVGMVCYNGKDTEGHDCIYIKMRRAAHYKGFDLRDIESELRNIFNSHYMGGGGHAGAVSFRFHPHDEKQFMDSVEKVSGYIKNKLT